MWETEESTNHSYWSEPTSQLQFDNSGYSPVYNSWSEQQQDDDNLSWASFSTGKSEPDEPIDWTDLEAISPDLIPEELFHQYIFSKRRFRAVGFKRHRFVGRPSKGKGKGKGGKRGKGKREGRTWQASS